MSRFQELKRRPPKLTFKDNPREVHFMLVSAMCDNEYKIVLRRKESGEYSMSAGMYSLSNFQMKGDYKTDAIWAAEDNKWDEVVNIINSGTSRVESIKSR